MKNQFMRAEEVARELEVSRSYAYRLIKQLNAELREKGYMTIAGRVNRQYFKERLYGTSDQKECESRVNAQGGEKRYLVCNGPVPRLEGCEAAEM